MGLIRNNRGSQVLVRTVNAGVHFGRMVEHDLATQSCELADATRLWCWAGANTLSEIAVKGPAMKGTNISERVASITLSGVIEVIPCTSEAAANLSTSRWNQ